MEEVTFDRSIFDKKEQFERRTKIIEVPELNEAQELDKDKVVVVKIQQLTLAEYVGITVDETNDLKTLIEGIVEAAGDAEMVKEETLKALRKASPATRRQWSFVVKGVVEPKMLTSEVIWLSQMFPNAINRIANAVVTLTESGAVKKNTTPLEQT